MRSSSLMQQSSLGGGGSSLLDQDSLNWGDEEDEEYFTKSQVLEKSKDNSEEGVKDVQANSSGKKKQKDPICIKQNWVNGFVCMDECGGVLENVPGLGKVRVLPPHVLPVQFSPQIPPNGSSGPSSCPPSPYGPCSPFGGPCGIGGGSLPPFNPFYPGPPPFPPCSQSPWDSCSRPGGGCWPFANPSCPSPCYQNPCNPFSCPPFGPWGFQNPFGPFNPYSNSCFGPFNPFWGNPCSPFSPYNPCNPCQLNPCPQNPYLPQNCCNPCQNQCPPAPHCTPCCPKPCPCPPPQCCEPEVETTINLDPQGPSNPRSRGVKRGGKRKTLRGRGTQCCANPNGNTSSPGQQCCGGPTSGFCCNENSAQDQFKMNMGQNCCNSSSCCPIGATGDDSMLCCALPQGAQRSMSRSRSPSPGQGAPTTPRTGKRGKRRLNQGNSQCFVPNFRYWQPRQGSTLYNQTVASSGKARSRSPSPYNTPARRRNPTQDNPHQKFQQPRWQLNLQIPQTPMEALKEIKGILKKGQEFSECSKSIRFDENNNTTNTEEDEDGNLGSTGGTESEWSEVRACKRRINNELIKLGPN